MSDHVAEAERLLRRFSRATNLLIATRPVHATPAGHPVAAAVEALAARIGALPPDPASRRAVGIDVIAGTFTLGGAPLPARTDADARLDFARAHMPVAAAIAGELGASGLAAGLRIGVSMTLEPKTANLALLLREAGASVAVYAHPDETDAAVADALRARGVPVTADASLAGEAEREAALAFLRDGADGSGLDVLMDDGSHLIRLAHEAAPELVRGWIGATEETTSGLTPLRSMERLGVLGTGVIAVNDAATKTLFDNRYGTAQSCVFAIADLLESLGIRLADAPALVIGYGPVGQGVAAYLRALGAEVAVAEHDPVRALQAIHDGFVVGEAEALAPGALVVSATGVHATVTAAIRDQAAIVAVAGGVPGEVELGDVEFGAVKFGAVEPGAVEPCDAAKSSPESVAPSVDRLPSGALLLDRGGCINVTAAEGNPIEIMDLSFATQLAALGQLLEARPGVGVHELEPARVQQVATEAARQLGFAAQVPTHREGGGDWRSPRYRRAI